MPLAPHAPEDAAPSDSVLLGGRPTLNPTRASGHKRPHPLQAGTGEKPEGLLLRERPAHPAEGASAEGAGGTCV